MKNDPVYVFMLGKQPNRNLETHLLYRGEVVTAAHNTALYELLSVHFLELRESLFIFEGFIGFEVVPSKYLTVAIEIEFG